MHCYSSPLNTAPYIYLLLVLHIAAIDYAIMLYAHMDFIIYQFMSLLLNIKAAERPERFDLADTESDARVRLRQNISTSPIPLPQCANEGGVGLTLLEAAAVCDLAALEAALGRGEDIGISDAEGR
jgi:hypothetical protein